MTNTTSDNKKKYDVGDIIKKIVKRSVIILGVIIGMLALAMFGPEFDQGIIQRDMLVSVLSSILSGYLGYVGAVVGIVGAYFVLKEQLNNEVNKIKEKESLDLKMMKNLLEYTVSETDYIMTSICDKYQCLYHKTLGREVLELKFKRAKGYIPDMVEHLICNGVLEDDIEIFSEIHGEGKYKDAINKINIGYGDYLDTYHDIYNIFIECDRELVYDGSWSNYLVAIKNTNKFSYDDIQAIIKWITILSSSAIYKNKEKVQAIDEPSVSFIYNKKLITTKVNSKIIDIERELINHIKDFIYYRDYVIGLIENKEKFGEDVMSGEFDDSANYMIEKIILTNKLEAIVED